MSGNGNQPGRTVTSKLSAILLTFAEGGVHSLSEIAEFAGLPMSTTHRLVTELAAWRILERDHASRRFRPGLSLRALGGSSCCATSIRDQASPVLEDLCRATGNDVRLGLLDGEILSYIFKTPDRPVSQFSPAATLPLHATALGKVLLAFSPPDLVDAVLSRDLRAYTPQTLVDRDRIRLSLKMTRAHRAAESDRELRADYLAIAAPVFGANGRPVAALEVRVRELAGPNQFEHPMLAVAAGSLSRELYRTCTCCEQSSVGLAGASIAAGPEASRSCPHRCISGIDSCHHRNNRQYRQAT